MHKMGQANIDRGEKWATEKARAVFEKRNKDAEWFDSQKSIVDDIKEYEEYKNSIKPEPIAEKPKKPKPAKEE